MASAHFGEDSDSDRHSRTGGYRHRTRRRGTKRVVWPREGNVDSNDQSRFRQSSFTERVRERHDFQSSELNMQASKIQDRRSYSRAHDHSARRVRGDRDRETYPRYPQRRQYDDRTAFTQNSSRVFCSESLSDEFDFHVPFDCIRPRQENRQYCSNDDPSFDQHGNISLRISNDRDRQHTSSRTKNKASFHYGNNEPFGMQYSHRRGRGGRRDRSRVRGSFSYSNRDSSRREDPTARDWREGMTKTGK